MALPIPAGTYDVDPMHTQVEFSVRHLGISSVRGTFDRFAGTLSLGETLVDTEVAVEVEMGSINTGNSMRDEHVAGAELLDAATYPHMTFRTTSIVESDSEYEMTGDLTIKGTTLPVTFRTTYNGSAVFPVDQSTHYGFTAVGTISRSAFGVSFGVPMVSDEVGLTLNVQFIRPAQDSSI